MSKRIRRNVSGLPRVAFVMEMPIEKGWVKATDVQVAFEGLFAAEGLIAKYDQKNCGFVHMDTDRIRAKGEEPGKLRIVAKWNGPTHRATQLARIDPRFKPAAQIA